MFEKTDQLGDELATLRPHMKRALTVAAEELDVLLSSKDTQALQHALRFSGPTTDVYAPGIVGYVALLVHNVRQALQATIKKREAEAAQVANVLREREVREHPERFKDHLPATTLDQTARMFNVK